MADTKGTRTTEEEPSGTEQPQDTGEQPAPKSSEAGVASELVRYVGQLGDASRRTRQEAAHAIAELSRTDPNALVDQANVVVPALTEALGRSEAQTRWESLDALAELAPSCADLVAQAFEGAETALFDEGSGRVRVAAFRLLARLGASSAKLSDQVWPLLDEAVQCFHGDPGYRGMLSALLELVRGKASKKTKEALCERIRFDAESGRGYVKDASAEVLAAAQGK